jgi:hypothetical protein
MVKVVDHEGRISTINKTLSKIERRPCGIFMTFKDSTKILDLRGDEWQVDAHVLKGCG